MYFVYLMALTEQEQIDAGDQLRRHLHRGGVGGWALLHEVCEGARAEGGGHVGEGEWRRRSGSMVQGCCVCLLLRVGVLGVCSTPYTRLLWSILIVIVAIGTARSFYDFAGLPRCY